MQDEPAPTAGATDASHTQECGEVSASVARVCSAVVAMARHVNEQRAGEASAAPPACCFVVVCEEARGERAWDVSAAVASAVGVHANDVWLPPRDAVDVCLGRARTEAHDAAVSSSSSHDAGEDSLASLLADLSHDDSPPPAPAAVTRTRAYVTAMTLREYITLYCMSAAADAVAAAAARALLESYRRARDAALVAVDTDDPMDSRDASGDVAHASPSQMSTLVELPLLVLPRGHPSRSIVPAQHGDSMYTALTRALDQLCPQQHGMSAEMRARERGHATGAAVGGTRRRYGAYERQVTDARSGDLTSIPRVQVRPDAFAAFAAAGDGASVAAAAASSFDAVTRMQRDAEARMYKLRAEHKHARIEKQKRAQKGN